MKEIVTWPKTMSLFNHWAKNAHHLCFSSELELMRSLVAPRGQTTVFQWTLTGNVCDAGFLEGLEVDMADPGDSKLSLSIDGDQILKDRNVADFGRGNKTPIAAPESDKILAFAACPIGDNGKADISKRHGYFCPNGTEINVSIYIPPGKSNVEVSVNLRMAWYTSRHDGYKVEVLP